MGQKEVTVDRVLPAGTGYVSCVGVRDVVSLNLPGWLQTESVAPFVLESAIFTPRLYQVLEFEACGPMPGFAKPCYTSMCTRLSVTLSHAVSSAGLELAMHPKLDLN